MLTARHLYFFKVLAARKTYLITARARKKNALLACSQVLAKTIRYPFLEPSLAYTSITSSKLDTSQSGHGHDSIDDNDSQAAQEKEAYSSARLAVLHQCELLYPIVYDTLNICSLYSSNKLTKLSVAQLRLICSYVLQHGNRGTTIKAKSALHYFYLGSCRVLFLH